MWLIVTQDILVVTSHWQTPYTVHKCIEAAALGQTQNSYVSHNPLTDSLFSDFKSGAVAACWHSSGFGATWKWEEEPPSPAQSPPQHQYHCQDPDLPCRVWGHRALLFINILVLRRAAAVALCAEWITRINLLQSSLKLMIIKLNLHYMIRV